MRSPVLDRSIASLVAMRGALAPSPRVRRLTPPRLSTRANASPRRIDRPRTIWIDTDEIDCVTAALESGVGAVVVTRSAAFAARCGTLASGMDVLTIDVESGSIQDANGATRAMVYACETPEGVEAMNASARSAALSGTAAVMDCGTGGNWSVIPAENAVAAFAGSERALLAVASTASEARVFLEALETGTDGIVLRTRDPNEVRAMRDVASGGSVALEMATVRTIERVGAGDRVAVDCATNFEIGEGMLCGSYASGLFLVHAENVECGYVASRPFRVNAGPTASYCKAPNGKTNYLSELGAGSEVLVVAADGKSRVTNVARVKIERRSLVLIKAEHPTAGTLSVLLQNAETVRLVRPNGEHVSVSELRPGAEVLVAVDLCARHAGTAVDEAVWSER